MMAAEGPENSVPAIGCVAKNWRVCGCVDTALQIASLVEPISITTAWSEIKFKT